MSLDNEFNTARLQSRLTLADCEAFLGVNGSTIRRWRAGTSKPPKSAIQALRMVGGYAPSLSMRGNDFKNWRFKGELLFTDEGMSFTATQIRSIWHVDQLLKGQAKEIKELRAVLLELREQVRPSKPDNVILFSDYVKRA